MSQYKPLHGNTANGFVTTVQNHWMALIVWIAFGISITSTCIQNRLTKGCVYRIPNLPTSVVFLVIHDKLLTAFGDEAV